MPLSHGPIKAGWGVSGTMRLPVSQAGELSARRMKAEGPRRIALRVLIKNRVAMAGLVVLVSVSLTALFAPQLSPYDPYEVDILNQLRAPSREHLLGTDLYGRDVLSRIFWGGRATLLVGLIAVAGRLRVPGFSAAELAGREPASLEETVSRVESIEQEQLPCHDE